jgi:hypothetical protein
VRESDGEREREREGERGGVREGEREGEGGISSIKRNNGIIECM